MTSPVKFSSDPDDWTFDELDEKDRQIIALRGQGLGWSAIARRVQLPRNEARDRYLAKFPVPSKHDLVQMTAEHIDRIDDLFMKVGASVALQQRILVDPDTNERVIIDTDPRLVIAAAAVQLRLLQDQRLVFGALMSIDERTRDSVINPDQSKAAVLDLIEEYRARRRAESSDDAATG